MKNERKEAWEVCWSMMGYAYAQDHICMNEYTVLWDVREEHCKQRCKVLSQVRKFQKMKDPDQ